LSKNTERHQDDQRQDEEPVPSVTTPHEPAVGEKRSREDDEPEDQQRPHQPPTQTQTGITPQVKIETLPQTQSGPTNGITGHAGYGAGVGMQAMNGAGSAGGGDALYIGDLQWVSWSCRLVSCAYFLSGVICVFFLSFFTHSGRLMRICVKSPWMLASIRLTTNTSHFLSIRLMGKAKGTHIYFVVVRSVTIVEKLVAEGVVTVSHISSADPLRVRQ
jgi:hypothetical protein